MLEIFGKLKLKLVFASNALWGNFNRTGKEAAMSAQNEVSSESAAIGDGYIKIVDDTGSYVEKFYREGHDKILNPFDVRPSVLSKERRGVADVENETIAINGKPEDLGKFIEGLTRKIKKSEKIVGTVNIEDFLKPSGNHNGKRSGVQRAYDESSFIYDRNAGETKRNGEIIIKGEKE